MRHRRVESCRWRRRRRWGPSSPRPSAICSLLALQGGLAHRSYLAEFVAKEILRPIPDISVKVEIERHQVGFAFFHEAKIEGRLIWFDLFLRNPALQPAQQMLA